MNLFTKIEQALTDIQHGWTTPEQAHMMAAAIITLRPDVSVEIGVYAGKGFISMALAHKETGHGLVIGVDPYSHLDSQQGQIDPGHKKFWTELNHEAVFSMAKENIQKFSVERFCRLERIRSNDFPPPNNIGVLRIDGNHGEQAIADAKRYCPLVKLGGILFMDDLSWAGGAVPRAVAMLKEEGWRVICRLHDTAVLQKIR